MSQSSSLTSTTAPGKVFATRAELAEHYQSDWHKYNLKRREAGLPVVLETDFVARLEAAQALRQEKKTAGKDHLKKSSNVGNRGGGDGNTTATVSTKQKNKKHFKGRNGPSQSSTPVSAAGASTAVFVSQVDAYDRIRHADGLKTVEPLEQTAEHNRTTTMETDDEPQATGNSSAGKDEAIEIDPRQCLFDRHVSSSIANNLKRMHRKYGFFLPDSEYLTDLEGLIGYCHEKIKLGHVCLYCQRVFSTWQGCQKHMISTGHTKLRYEVGIDQDEYSVFYDFSDANAEFLGRSKESVSSPMIMDEKVSKMEEEEKDAEDDDVGEWEDVSDDEQGNDDAVAENENTGDDDEWFQDFDEEVARFGLDVNILGELILPDGRIVGHRSLRRYYKQRAPRTDSEAVQAARLGAQERLYRGNVYLLGSGNSNERIENGGAMMLAQAGISPALAAGRAGRGILTATNAMGASGGYTQLSVYRYRAAIRKQRRGDVQGLRLYNKTMQNMNRMDKKANRLLNGVSVAHAAR